MRIEKRLTIGGEEFPLASDRVVFELAAVGQGFFHVTKNPAGRENAIALFSAGYGGQAATPVLSGQVAEIHLVHNGEWRVVVKDGAFALDAPAGFALRHPTPRDVLTAIEAATGLEFLTPAEAPYLAHRAPYFCGAGTCREALAAMGPVWGLPHPLWAALPDGRIFWGDWADSPFNVAPVELASMLALERDPEARAVVLSYLPRLRPGVLVNLADPTGGAFKFVVARATLYADKARLEWGAVA